MTLFEASHERSEPQSDQSTNSEALPRLRAIEMAGLTLLFSAEAALVFALLKLTIHPFFGGSLATIAVIDRLLIILLAASFFALWFVTAHLRSNANAISNTLFAGLLIGLSGFWVSGGLTLTMCPGISETGEVSQTAPEVCHPSAPEYRP